MHASLRGRTFSRNRKRLSIELHLGNCSLPSLELSSASFSPLFNKHLLSSYSRSSPPTAPQGLCIQTRVDGWSPTASGIHGTWHGLGHLARMGIQIDHKTHLLTNRVCACLKGMVHQRHESSRAAQ